jgi:oxygen-dependent protoporphyrinogen oxidase
MGRLVDALVDALRSRNVQLQLDTAVTDLDALDADTIVVTVPAYRAAPLLRGCAPDVADLLDGIAYASVVMVTFAFANDAIARPLDASGFLVPRTEGLLMTASSWSSSKWAHLANDTSTLMRVSAGRFGDERASNLDDDALVRALLDEVRTTTDVTGEPLDVRVRRWPESFPQYEPGHLDRVDAIERQLAATLPHVVLAGAALRGIGVPACIRQGREAALAVLSR